VYRRSAGDGGEVIVALNLSADPVNFVLSGKNDWSVVVGTDPHRWDAPFPGILRLAPFEGVVLAGPQ